MHRRDRKRARGAIVRDQKVAAVEVEQPCIVDLLAPWGCEATTDARRHILTAVVSPCGDLKRWSCDEPRPIKDRHFSVQHQEHGAFEEGCRCNCHLLPRRIEERTACIALVQHIGPHSDNVYAPWAQSMRRGGETRVEEPKRTRMRRLAQLRWASKGANINRERAWLTDWQHRGAVSTEKLRTLLASKVPWCTVHLSL